MRYPYDALFKQTKRLFLSQSSQILDYYGRTISTDCYNRVRSRTNPCTRLAMEFKTAFVHMDHKGMIIEWLLPAICKVRSHEPKVVTCSEWVRRQKSALLLISSFKTIYMETRWGMCCQILCILNFCQATFIRKLVAQIDSTKIKKQITN